MKKIVIIDWVDSVKASDWTLIEDVDEKPVDCISVGFLLKETGDYVIIAQNYGLEPEQICNLITVPKCSIRNIMEIKERYTWKPSDEQMNSLNDVISSRDIGYDVLISSRDFKYDVLSELWKDLKKLREE